MKTIKCDRCGAYIPYRPPYMNVNSRVPPIMVSVWYPLETKLQEVDLCDECKSAVYDFIFDFGNGKGA